MRLSEFKDEEALELLANLIEPLGEMFQDAEVRLALKQRRMLRAAKFMIANHKRAVFEMLAAMEKTPVEEFSCNVLTLPAKLLEINNDPEFIRLFQFAAAELDEKPSGAASGAMEEE